MADIQHENKIIATLQQTYGGAWIHADSQPGYYRVNHNGETQFIHYDVAAHLYDLQSIAARLNEELFDDNVDMKWRLLTETFRFKSLTGVFFEDLFEPKEPNER